jgi:hypothetical protein
VNTITKWEWHDRVNYLLGINGKKKRNGWSESFFRVYGSIEQLQAASIGHRAMQVFAFLNDSTSQLSLA